MAYLLENARIPLVEWRGKTASVQAMLMWCVVGEGERSALISADDLRRRIIQSPPDTRIQTLPTLFGTKTTLDSHAENMYTNIHVLSAANDDPKTAFHEPPTQHPANGLLDFTSSMVFANRFFVVTSATQRKLKNATQVKGVARCFEGARSER